MGKCIVCKNELDNIYKFDNMPSGAQNIPNKDELKYDKAIDLNLSICRHCLLVQLDNKPVIYYKEVIRSGGISSTMYNLRKKQYNYFINRCNLKNKDIIEVGCGGGEFLEVLNEYEVNTYGIENKKELVEYARIKGLNVRNKFADDKNTVFFEGKLFDAFTSFNFLEHQPDPVAYLEAIYNNLKDEAYGLITVPALEYLLEKQCYYEIIIDHLAYYSINSLSKLLYISGFKVIFFECINRDTISVIVQKIKKVDKDNILLQSDKDESYDESSLLCMAKSIIPIKEDFLNLLDYYNKQNKTVAIWGAGHQGFCICASLELGSRIKYIIDSAPFKQNKFAPVSHIPIISFENAQKDMVDAIIIIAPGYSNEIEKIIRASNCNVDIYTLMSKEIERLR